MPPHPQLPGMNTVRWWVVHGAKQHLLHQMVLGLLHYPHLLAASEPPFLHIHFCLLPQGLCPNLSSSLPPLINCSVSWLLSVLYCMSLKGEGVNFFIIYFVCLCLLVPAHNLLLLLVLVHWASHIGVGHPGGSTRDQLPNTFLLL